MWNTKTKYNTPKPELPLGAPRTASFPGILAVSPCPESLCPVSQGASGALGFTAHTQMYCTRSSLPSREKAALSSKASTQLPQLWEETSVSKDPLDWVTTGSKNCGMLSFRTLGPMKQCLLLARCPGQVAWSFDPQSPCLCNGAQMTTVRIKKNIVCECDWHFLPFFLNCHEPEVKVLTSPLADFAPNWLIPTLRGGLGLEEPQGLQLKPS
jgi:hypothetical protein